MTTTPRTCHLPRESLPDEAINLFLEYRDQHGHDEDRARAAAVLEVLEGDRMRCADMGREPCEDCRSAAAQREVIGALVGTLEAVQARCGGCHSDIEAWSEGGKLVRYQAPVDCATCRDVRAVLERARKLL